MSKLIDSRGRRLGLHPDASTLSPSKAQEILHSRTPYSSPTRDNQVDERKSPLPNINKPLLQYPFLHRAYPQPESYMKNEKSQDRASPQADKAEEVQENEINEQSSHRNKLQKTNNGRARLGSKELSLSHSRNKPPPLEPYPEDRSQRHSNPSTQNQPPFKYPGESDYRFSIPESSVGVPLQFTESFERSNNVVSQLACL